MKTKIIHTAIVAALLAGCQSESSTQGATPAPQDDYTIQPVGDMPEPEDKFIDPIDSQEPVDKFIDPICLPGDCVIGELPTPKPSTPIFAPEGVSTITQQPYSGTVIRGGDAYLRYYSGITDFQDFELPEWSVTYKYEPLLEVLITNGGETLCARYSWKLNGFGYAKPNCLWSDVRQAVPLEDMQAAYYVYSVVETRVWVSGAIGLRVEVE